MLIPLPDPTPIPAGEAIARSELIRINQSVDRRIQEHKERFEAFWSNSQATPDEILAGMGSNAIVWLMSAQESYRHLDNIAKLVGKDINAFLPPAYYAPRREFIIDKDYNVSLVPPAPGYDAYGNYTGEPEE